MENALVSMVILVSEISTHGVIVEIDVIMAVADANRKHAGIEDFVFQVRLLTTEARFTKWAFNKNILYIIQIYALRPRGCGLDSRSSHTSISCPVESYEHIIFSFN